MLIVLYTPPGTNDTLHIIHLNCVRVSFESYWRISELPNLSRRRRNHSQVIF